MGCHWFVDWGGVGRGEGEKELLFFCVEVAVGLYLMGLGLCLWGGGMME